MPSTGALSTFARPSQVILGTTDFHEPEAESSTAASQRRQKYQQNVIYLRGRDARDGLTVQASFNQVCILSREQRFDQALPFWDAFSGSQDTDSCVSCVAVGLSVDSSQILLVAAMDHRIAVWYSSTSSPSSSRRWKVHSTLTVNDGLVTTLDIVNGQLLTGTTASLALWRLDSSDIPIWRRLWTKAVPAPISIAKFSPDATSIAAVAQGGQNVLLWQYQPRSSKLPILQQRLYHARPVSGLEWRQPPERNSQADVLISYASDGVARIWGPVIDEPTQLRLWSSVQSPRSFDSSSKIHDSSQDVSDVFYLDSHVVCTALRLNVSILQREIQMAELGVGSSNEVDAHTLELDMDLKRTRLRRLEQLANETPDMFVSFEQDGHVGLTAVANIDRRPPTLLQAFTVLRIPFELPNTFDTIRSVKVLPLYTPPDAPSTAAMLTLYVELSTGESFAYAINPATFFDGRGAGIESDTCHPCGPPATWIDSVNRPRRHTSRIESLNKSGNGRVLLSSSAKESITWTMGGQLQCESAVQIALLTALSWDGSLMAQLYADGTGEVRRMSDGSMARFECDADVRHIALSLNGGADVLIVVTRESVVHSWAVESRQSLQLATRRTARMWDDSPDNRHVMSLETSPSPSGQPGNEVSLITKDTFGLVEVRRASGNPLNELRWEPVASFHDSTGTPKWVRCNATGLVAIVYCDNQNKQTLVIYDCKTVSFNSGEEHRQTLSSEDKIIALDWSPSPLLSSALAVMFEHHVDVIAPGRVSAFGETDASARSKWEQLARFDLRSCTPSSIRAGCWLSSGLLVVSSGSVLFVYGPWVQATSQGGTSPKKMHLSELMAEIGGPLVQYHPSFLLQCGIWGKMGLAKAIITNLEKAVFACTTEDVANTWLYEDAPLELVLQDDHAAVNVGPGRKTHGAPRGSLFDEPNHGDTEADDFHFGSERIHRLANQLHDVRPPHLSDADRHNLDNLIKTIGEADQEHRSMDASALRYMLALRQKLNGADSSRTVDTASNVDLSYRAFLWAFHSENQETLLAAVESAYQNKLDWPAARSTGLFVWLKNPQALRAQAEAVARAQFMSGDDRDPVKCSLLYFALGKRKVVQGLWRQAVWHPEQKKMLQFLSHDFDEERWKTAAQKNAFALLSQRRYEFAASFFMLGDSLRDAINVCVRNLDDLPLAIALARVKEGRDDGPIFTELLRNRVLPLTFETGDRWMGSWAFWMLKRRDLAVRIIVTPLRDLLADESVASLLGSKVTCGNDSSNDPALALLFQQLRTKSLQTIKGLYDIPEKRVFDFVLNTNRALCRMGCHTIGLSLLRNWQFEPPSVSSASTLFHRVSKHDLETLSRVDEAVLAESTDAFSELRSSDAMQDQVAPTSPTHLRRRPSQSTMSPPSSPRMMRRRSSLLRRRSSIINDLDIGKAVSHAFAATKSIVDKEKGASLGEKNAILTAEPTDASTANGASEAKAEAPEPKKKGISVFKSAAASNSQQGAQEFDFSSFGF